MNCCTNRKLLNELLNELNELLNEQNELLHEQQELLNELLNERFSTVLSARGEMVDGILLPAVASLGWEWQLLPQAVLVKGTASKNYRIPTMNDLYWAGVGAMGNKELVPEYGWSGDVGLQERFKLLGGQTTLSQTMFYSYTNNWMLWQPLEGGIWTPVNKDTGRSYGLENRMQSTHAVSQFRLVLDAFYTWTNARIIKENAQTVDKPFTYIPEHQLNGSISLVADNYSIRYSHFFSGERYYDNERTADDYGRKLDRYHLAYLSASYQFSLSKYKFTAAFTIHNLWNSRYEVTMAYATPLRNYQLAFTWDIRR